MTQFLVDLDELDGVIADMRTFDQKAEAACADADQTIAALHVTWEGDAAEAQKQAHDRITRGLNEMREALGDLTNVAQTAHQNYSDAAATNRGMFPS
ncbi:pore-forming CpnT exporter EsxE [Gordonia jinhuaensis]|uniref:ESAT-6-like protein n=1 Tax=Gordonia jinhuaensis TaxID=1517702 RepID=A0A916X0J7_9ACTN|nr:WXG100 family type VII secretion target [Gordonia jinhuaensis]GGB48569.1 secretion protein [Gordonia jinhuaensis]